MREIKFRGKRKDTGEWVYGYFTRNDESGRCYITTQSKTGGAYPREVDPATVGQYTGLKDKNGKKIYEGDIVKTLVNFGPAGNEEKILPVEITPFGINVQHWVFEEEGCLPEVIGNMYDNPELLEMEP